MSHHDTSQAKVVASIIKAAVDYNPHGIAIDFEGEEEITYRDLADKAERLAQQLKGIITPGESVVVVLPRSVAQIVTIVTIAWLGAVYVPLDPEIPQGRLDNVLSRLSGPVIVSNHDFLCRYVPGDQILGNFVDVQQCLAENTESIPKYTDADWIVTRRPDDVAVILFTSGSTGEPKGVKLSNQNVVEPIRYLSKQQHINSSSRILQFAGPAFDVHMLDIFCGLFNGATLCLVSKDRLLSQLAFWINKMEANMIHLTPSVLSMLKPEDVPGIQYMLSSGESIRQESIDTWAATRVLFNLYGPCEASSIVGSRLLPGRDASIIGETTPYAELLILDEYGHPVSQGEVGEIFCSGKTVFLGYLGDEKLTQSKFRDQGPDLPPLFATGDLGLITEDGLLKLLGRIDSQVKINGQRVELLEIDHTLCKVAAQAVTRWKRDPGGQIRLHSFVAKISSFCHPSDDCVVLEKEEFLVEKLQKICEATLPSYMIPKIIPVSGIPLNASDKIDQRRLDLLFESYIQSSRNIQEVESAGTSPTEQVVARIISEQLCRPVGAVNANLLSLGLSSLDIMVTLKNIHQEFGLALSLREILQNPTVYDIAAKIDAHCQQKQSDILQSQDKELLPNSEAAVSSAKSAYFVTTSTSQDRIFAADKLLGNSAYNCNFVLQVSNFALDVQKFKEAIWSICARHETLHSTYHDAALSSSHNPQPLVAQQVHPITELPPRWKVISTKELKTFDIESDQTIYNAALARIKIEGERLFDLEIDSPIRVDVYEIEHQIWIIHFNIHHISMDEWSFHLITSEIEKEYSRLLIASKDSAFVLPSPVQYSEFARWQRSVTKDDEYQDHVAWWIDHIGDEIASLRPEDLAPLPPSFDSIKERNDGSRLFTQPLDADLFTTFEQDVCAGSTAFLGWLSLFQALLSRVSRKTEFLVAVPATERSATPEFFDVVGFCLNTVMVPSIINCTDSFGNLLTRTQNNFLAGILHPVPYEDIVSNLADKRQNGRDSVRLTVMFVLHDLRTSSKQAVDPQHFLENAEHIQLPSKGADFPLIVHIDPNYHPPRLILQHRMDTFRSSFIETLGRGFASLLRSVVEAGPNAPLKGLNLISPIDQAVLERQSVVSKIPAKTHQVWLEGKGTTLANLFQEQVQAHCQKVAIETISGATLTYAELYQRSLALSSYIRERGVKPNNVVIVAMDKSPELVVAVLAIILSGACFLMIDPTHKNILNETKVRVSGAVLIITDEKSLSAVQSFDRPGHVDIIPYLESTWSDRSDYHQLASFDIPVTAAAWLCFTSGSTGSPKCFSIPHSSAAASLMGMIDYFKYGPGTRMPLLSNVVFDVCISSILSPLLSGGTLCIAPAESFVTNLEETLNLLSVTHMEATPSVVATLSGPSGIPSLQSLSFGGEPPSQEVTQKWLEKITCYNIYCPAECTIIGFIHQFRPTDDPAGMMRNVGQKTAAIRSLILDAEMQPVLPGAAGYLHIGSYSDGRLGQLSTGYLAPLSANAKFSIHPSVGRIYNTGDLAYYDEHGSVHLIGREDDQVKLHGIRFDLSDVEASADSLLPPGSRTISIVTGVSDRGEKALIAFIQHPEWAVSANRGSFVGILDIRAAKILRTLRDQLDKRLHDVMVPRYWIPLSWIPQGITGKADRNLLRQWVVDLSKVDPATFRSFATLKTDSEESAKLLRSALEIFDSRTNAKVLRECWQDTLGLEDNELLLDQSFFHSGGDSISAIRFCSRVRARKIHGCTVSQLYRTSTLLELSTALEPLQEQLSTKTHDPAVNIHTGYNLLRNRPTFLSLQQSIQKALTEMGQSDSNIESIWPVRHMQKVMLLQGMEKKGRYIPQIHLTFSGQLDIQRLKKAWLLLQQAHESMRTTFFPVYHSKKVEYFAAILKKPSTSSSFSSEVLPLPGKQQFEALLECDRNKGFQFGDLFHRLSVFQSSDKTYRVVLTIHHAIVDGWSLDIIYHELAKAYRSQTLSLGPSLSAFMAIDIERDEPADLKFWKDHLDGLQSFSFSSRSAGTENSSLARMATARTHIDITANQLSISARHYGVTSAVVLEAATALFLSRATNREDVAFGMTTNGRNASLPGITDMVGLFINTIPVRIQVNGQMTPESLYRRLAKDFASSLPHENVPLSKIFSNLFIKQNLFDIVLVYENFDSSLKYDFGENVSLVEIDGQEFSEFPLTIVVEHTSKGTQIVFKWDDRLLTSVEAASWVEQYAAILTEMVLHNKDGCPLNQIATRNNYSEYYKVQDLYESHRQQMNQSASTDTLVHLLKRSAKYFSKRIALHSHKSALTFQELDEQSDWIAQSLVQCNVSHGDVVPIIFSRSNEMILAMFGIMKAGAAYSPLDPKAPPLRHEKLIRKVGGKVVLIGQDIPRSSSETLEASGLAVISCEQLLNNKHAEPAIRLPELSPTDKCYVLWTSGTTGEPKGCILSHAAVVNVVLETSAIYGISTDTRMLLFANYTFDASVVDIYGCVARGATLCIASEDELLSDLNLAVLNLSITHLHITPSIIRFLDSDACKPLKTLISGGEKLPTSLRDRWAPLVRLFDGYGPTETAVQVSVTEMSLETPSSTIHSSVTGNFLILLDHDAQIPRIGQVAEICIGGKQIFNGYIGEDELTANALTTGPMDANMLLYRSGDLGRYDTEMNIHILGRKDNQTKVSGQRVEVQEIESVIGEMPGVATAGVISSDHQLIAVVERKPPTTVLDADALRSFCYARLPAQLIPSRFIFSTVELTRSGKINRQKLAQLAFDTKTSPQLSVFPVQLAQSPTETYILQAISNLLGTEIVNADASFLALGLTSLFLMELRSIVSHYFLKSLSFSDINSSGTARRLGIIVNSAPSIVTQSHTIEFVADRVEALPTQTRMWLAQQRLQDDTYNVCNLTEFHNVSVSQFSKAVQMMVNKFDAFRTTFTWDDQRNLLQVLQPQSTVCVEFQESSNWSDVQALCREHSKRVFDLENGPLAHFVIFDCGSNVAALFYTIHHILVDEWTCQQILSILSDFYNDKSPSVAFKSTLEYATVALEDRTISQSLENLALEVEEVPPFDTGNWPVASSCIALRQAGHAADFVSSEEFHAFRCACMQEGISWFSSLLGLFQLLLHRYTASNDLGVLVPVSTRGAVPSSVNNVFGNLVNTALIRSIRKGEMTLKEFIKHSATSIERALDSAMVPLEDLLARIKTTVDQHSVILVVQESSVKSSFDEVKDRSQETFDTQTVAFDLQLNLISSSTGILIDLQYDASKFDANYMEEIATAYGYLLRGSFAMMEMKLKDVDLSTAEQQVTMEGFANFPKVLPPVRDVLLHELFIQMVAKQPDAIAIDHWNGYTHELITYDQLDQKSTSLASQLQTLYSIDVGDIVPIYVDQGPYYLIAVLATLKTGATFTPMAQDGTWPAERVIGIVKECAARVVIADIVTPEGLSCPTLQIGSVNMSLPQPVLCAATADSIAYILWTSGTTGAPKGVMIPHSSSVMYMQQSAANVYKGTSADRTFQFASPVFDASMEDLFRTFVEGGVVCTAPRELLLSDLQNVFRALRPTTANLTPTIISMLEPFVGSLRVLLSAGEAQNERVRADWAGSSTIYVNACGPTENTVISYCGQVNPTSNIRSSGRALPGVTAFIFDSFGKLCPQHVIGTVYLGGSQLLKGYLNQPELTAATISIHPKYGRLYNSGDVAYYDTEGNIIHCGRGDDQVKIRGVRLELNGISSLIEESEHVQRAMVVKDQEKLVAFVVWTDDPEHANPNLVSVVLNKDTHAKLEAVQNSLRFKGSSAMMPSIWIQINRVPMRQSGKADHKLLRSLIVHQVDQEQETGKPPTSETERILHDAACKILGLPNVSVDSDVFELGMDSFSIIRFLGEVRKASPRYSLTLRHVADMKTIEALASTLEKEQLAQGTTFHLDLPTTSKYANQLGVEILAPASTIQERFYWAQLLLKNATYNVPSLFKAWGLALEDIEYALKSIFSENSIFRTNFVCSTAVHQKIRPVTNVPITIYDFSNEVSQRAQSKTRELCIRDAATPFDLHEGPLTRVMLFKMPDAPDFLYLNFHHIIIDEESIRRIAQEVSTRCDSGQIDVNHQSLQYADFAEQEQKLLADSSVSKESENFWSKYLSDFNPSTIPPFHAGSGEPNRATFHHEFVLGQDGIDWVRRHGITNFSAFLTLYMILLRRLWNLNDPAVLIPVSQRPGTAEHIYGCFINTVPVRAKIDGTEHLGSLFSTMSKNIFQVLENSHLPYERILQMSNFENNDFNLMFVYHESSAGQSGQLVNTPELLSEKESEIEGSPKFPVTFSVTLQEHEKVWNVQLNVEYDSNKVSQKAVEVLCSHFESLTEAATNSANDIQVGLLDILIPEESQFIRDQTESIAPTPDQNYTFSHELVYQRVLDCPDQIACIFEGEETITYRQLWNKVEFISEELRPLNIGAGSKVCIFLDAGFDRIASILAVMHCGMAWVPLDVTFPAARNAAIVQDCGPQIILTNAGLDQTQENSLYSISEILDNDVPVRFLPAVVPSTNNKPLSGNIIGPKDLAYILYTSGTTGKPKGVEIEHLPLLNSTLDHQQLLRIRKNSRILQFAPWTFDVSIMDIFAALTTGATLCLGTKAYLMGNFNSIFSFLKITHVVTTPTVISILSPDEAPCLEVLAMSGEPMSAKVRDIWADRPLVLLNAYGPTETCVHVISCQIKSDTIPGKIGLPMPGNTAYILNEQLSLCPFGTVGQLAIGGFQLARGYLNRPDENKSFVVHPTLGRIYLTGDLAVMNYDRSVVCFGRIDNQIKLRGQRIELEEITNIAMVHPAVRNTIAMIVDQDGTSTLTLIFEPSVQSISSERVTKEGEMIKILDPTLYDSAVQEIHANLVSKLPSYAVPQIFIPLSFIPKDKNGKMDRKAPIALVASLTNTELQPYHIKVETTTETTPLSTPTESEIASAIRQVLGEKDVYANSNFFSLSGDSISAIRLCTTLRGLGYILTIKDIYDHPTVAELAQVLDFSSPVDIAPKCEVVDSHGVLCHTPIMDWFFNSEKTNPHWYNQANTLKLPSPSVFEGIVKTWKQLTELHPALRVRCDVNSSLPRVHIPAFTSADDFLCSEHIVSSDEDIKDIALKSQSSLNLERGPISALSLIQTPSNSYCLIAVHHLAIDIVSWQIIFDDLEQSLAGKEIFPEFDSMRTWSFHIHARQQAAAKDKKTRQKSSIMQSLHDNSAIVDNYNDRKHLNVQGSIGLCDISLDTGSTNCFLTEANRLYGTEPLDLLIAALVLALHRWKRMQACELVLESHGRDLQSDVFDFSRTVGWFTYMSKVVFSFASGMTIGDLVAQTKDIRRKMSKELDFSVSTVKNSDSPVMMFNYAGTYNTKKQGSKPFETIYRESTVFETEDPRNVRSSVFDFNSAVTDGVLNLSILYSQALHSDPEIRSLLDSWKSSLEDILHFTSTNFRGDRLPTACDFPDLGIDAYHLRSFFENNLRTFDIHFNMVESVVQATDMQTAMMMARQEHGLYIQDFEYHIAGKVDLQKFSEAWKQVVRKYSVLRTIFAPAGNMSTTIGQDIVQVIIKPEHFEPTLFFSKPLPAQSHCQYGRPLFNMYLQQQADGSYNVRILSLLAVVDGWSMSLLLRDINQAYKDNLNPVAVNFAHFYTLIESELEERKSKEFWRQELADANPIELIDYAVSPSTNATKLNSVLHHSLDFEMDDLQHAASINNTTVATLLRAAWALVLSQFTNERNISFGVSSAGRASNVDGVEDAVGTFLNTVPFCIDLSSDDTQDIFLQRIKDKSSSILLHENLSLRKIYKESGRSCLFNTALIFQNHPHFMDDDTAPFTLEMVSFEETTDIPLNVVTFKDNHGKLGVRTMLHGQNFSEPFVREMIFSFGKSLEWIRTGSKSSVISEINFSSGFSPVNSCVPTNELGELSVWNLFLRQAQFTPTRSAICFSSHNGLVDLSYEDLLQRISIAATAMKENNVKSGSRVAIILDKSPDMTAVILAILSVGAVFVPVDVDLSAERLQRMLRLSESAHIVTSEDYSHTMNDFEQSILTVESLFRSQHSKSSTPSLRVCETDELSAILFTSGTSGEPKGVLMPNRQIAGYVLNMIQAYRYSSESRIFGFARNTFDVWLSDTFGSLSCGATLCFGNQTDILDNFEVLLNKTQATTVNLTPSVASLLEPDNLPNLKSLVLTGEPATQKLINKWATKVHLVNSYGPTEAGVITYTDVDSSTDPRCVGKPVHGMDVLLLNSDLQRVPIGTPGFIHCSGTQLSLGYCNPDDAIEQPFTSTPHGNMYNTGDIGAYDRNGNITILGRGDKQIKLHGQRIDLAEVERGFHGTNISTYTMLFSEEQSKTLITFFTSNSEDPHDPQTMQNISLLEKAARQHLLTYMIPKAFIPLHRFPFTFNGKMDVSSLARSHKHWRSLLSTPTDKTEAALTPTEIALWDLLADSYEIPGRFADLDLWAMVLDSLSAIQFAQNLRSRFSIPFPVTSLYGIRFVRDLALEIDNKIACMDN